MRPSVSTLLLLLGLWLLPRAGLMAQEDGLVEELAVPSEVAAASEPGAPAFAWLDEIDGSLSLAYRHRVSEDDTDVDLYQYLRLRFGADGEAGWSGSFYGRLSEDLDADGRNDEFFSFNEITTTYDSSVNGRVHDGWLAFRPRGSAIELLRGGRQTVFNGEPFDVDGLHVQLRPIESLGGAILDLSAGVPAHLQEASPDGDWIATAGLAIAPWDGARARVDYVHLEDKNRYYGLVRNDLFAFHLGQRVSDWLRLSADYQHLGGNPRQLRAYLDGGAPTGDLHVRASMRALFSPQRELAFDIDPFTAVAQTLEPYWNGDLAVSRSVGEHVVLEGGVTLRRLFDADDEGRYNRELTRYHLSAIATEFLAEGLTLSLTAEFHDSHDEVIGVSAEADYRASDSLRWSAGTDFARWRLDFFEQNEALNSQGVFVRLRWRVRDRTRLDVSGRVEIDDLDTYGIFRTAVRFEF